MAVGICGDKRRVSVSTSRWTDGDRLLLRLPASERDPGALYSVRAVVLDDGTKLRLRGVSPVTPYYEDPSVRLYLGDCREVLPSVSGDVVVTDVPYNCGKNYGETTDDNLPWPEWCAWMDETVALCKAAAPNVFSFLSQTAAKKYERLGNHERDWCLIWNKPLSLSICAAPFMPHWEPIFYWGQQRRKHSKDGGALWGSDVLTCNVETGADRWDHPTPKPILLMLDLVSKFDGVVIDPFAGSGTTLAACKQAGKVAIGIEVNERYCECIARRLESTGLYARAVNGQRPLFAQESA
jgi:hypothetical protein